MSVYGQRHIRYTILETPFGQLLAAATSRGLCALSLGDQASELVGELRVTYPTASLEQVHPADPALRPWVDSVVRHLHGEGTRLAMPIDVDGTPFQHRVWEALRAIPLGETRSYADIATAIGSPRAVRAVASACAQNRVALVVPCHRVIRSDGQPGEYHWGAMRKRALLHAEREQAAVLAAHYVA